MALPRDHTRPEVVIHHLRDQGTDILHQGLPVEIWAILRQGHPVGIWVILHQVTHLLSINLWAKEHHLIVVGCICRKDQQPIAHQDWNTLL